MSTPAEASRSGHPAGADDLPAEPASCGARCGRCIEGVHSSVDSGLKRAGLNYRQRLLAFHFFDQLKEQVWAVLPISFLLIFVIGAFFQQTATSPGETAYGLLCAIFGLMFFMEGLRVCVMPLGELVGRKLPLKYPLPVVLLVAGGLGILVTYAEPAIASLAPLAQQVDRRTAPYLYFALNDQREMLVLSIGLGVGLAAVVGTLRFVKGWSLKPIIYTTLVPCVGLACYMQWGNPDLAPLLGLAWDCGAVTTGPVTVPILLAMGIGVMKSQRQKRLAKAALQNAVDTNTGQTLEGFGVVTLASLFPVLAVEIMGIMISLTKSKEDIMAGTSSGVSTAAVDQSPTREVIFAIRAIAPLITALFLLVVVVLREPLPDLSLYTVPPEVTGDDDSASGRDLASVSRAAQGSSGNVHPSVDCPPKPACSLALGPLEQGRDTSGPARTPAKNGSAHSYRANGSTVADGSGRAAAGGSSSDLARDSEDVPLPALGKESRGCVAAGQVGVEQPDGAGAARLSAPSLPLTLDSATDGAASPAPRAGPGSCSAPSPGSSVQLLPPPGPGDATGAGIAPPAALQEGGGVLSEPPAAPLPPAPPPPPLPPSDTAGAAGASEGAAAGAAATGGGACGQAAGTGAVQVAAAAAGALLPSPARPPHLLVAADAPDPEAVLRAAQKKHVDQVRRRSGAQQSGRTDAQPAVVAQAAVVAAEGTAAAGAAEGKAALPQPPSVSLGGASASGVSGDVRVVLDGGGEEGVADGPRKKWYVRYGGFIAGAIMAQLGMITFNIGLTYGFTALGNQAGMLLPAAYLEVPGLPKSPYYDYVGGIILVMVVAFCLGFLATRAEPALRVLGATVQHLSGGSFTAAMLIYAVSVGVGVGMGVGSTKILFGVPIIYIILVKYTVAVALTLLAPEDFTNIAWDSAGVTTGPVTVPFVLSLGIGFSKATNATEGFGILTAASVAPIISVLLTNLLKKPAQAAVRSLSRLSSSSAKSVGVVLSRSTLARLSKRAKKHKNTSAAIQQLGALAAANARLEARQQGGLSAPSTSFYSGDGSLASPSTNFYGAPSPSYTHQGTSGGLASPSSAPGHSGPHQPSRLAQASSAASVSVVGMGGGDEAGAQHVASSGLAGDGGSSTPGGSTGGGGVHRRQRSSGQGAAGIERPSVRFAAELSQVPIGEEVEGGSVEGEASGAGAGDGGEARARGRAPPPA